MNSYGSVSRVSESIYKLLRYMNWVSDDDANPVQTKLQSDQCSSCDEFTNEIKN
jgi:hypothetical protein